MSTPKLEIIVGSTRPGRVGLAVAQWFQALATRRATFEVRFVDLAEIDLPIIDEPNHPRLKRYQNRHTIAWSEMVGWADAFVVVTPEYNYGAPPALVNALDYLSQEWHYKPLGFVSYGGVSGGTRAVQMIKQIAGAVKMVPLVESVIVPFVASHLDDEGRFVPPEVHEQAGILMLDELLRWTNALAVLRS